MVLTSFLVVFINNGASEVGTYGRLGTSYPSVMTGIFFLCIIATEFFINYKVMFKHSLNLPFGKLKLASANTAEYKQKSDENDAIVSDKAFGEEVVEQSCQTEVEKSEEVK